MSDALTRAGELAALEAERLWQLDIIDPPRGSKDPRAPVSLKVINEIIDRNGWGTNVRYVANGSPQWCGFTAGWCWSTAGLDASWLPSYWASTYRLGLWARYRRFSATAKANPRPTDERDRRVYESLRRGTGLAIEPRRGDIVIVGDGEPADGDHVTIVVGWNPVRRVFDTISGNGGGVGPRGDKREGISRRAYSIDAATGYRAMWLIRPAFGDLLAEKPNGPGQPQSR